MVLVSPSVDHWCAVFREGGDFGDRITEDGFEGISADPGSGFEDDTGFPVAWDGLGGVYEYGELSWWRVVRDAEFGQGHRFPP